MMDSYGFTLIVCGDSTAVGRVKNSRVDISEGPPCLAKSLINSFPNLQCIGDQGLTAEEIYREVQSFNFPEDPCIVVVTFGTNDVARCVDLETTIKHTRKILEHFRSQEGYSVIGLPPYPFHHLPLVEAVLNNWQGDYGNIQSIQAYFNDLPKIYKAFKDKSLEEIKDHADALIAGMEKVFRDAEQPFLLELIEGVRDKSFEERKRSFQYDGIHPTKGVYSYIARLIQSKIEELESQFMLSQSATDRLPSL